MDHLYKIMLSHTLRFILLTLFVSTTIAVSCDQLSTLYSQANCCSNSDTNTCLRQIPLCTTASNGYVCSDSNGNIIVKGLLDAFAFESNQITLKKHIIPDTNAAYDLGNAEYKIRYLFQSSN